MDLFNINKFGASDAMQMAHYKLTIIIIIIIINWMGYLTTIWLHFTNEQKPTILTGTDYDTNLASVADLAFNPNNPLISFSQSSSVDSVEDELRPTCDQSLHNFA